ncbi:MULTISPECIES: 3-oxoacyl-[acyl-carrier-protein] reductase [Acidiphilium]|uniref:3-oxoacyl-[acyl-carrier-protein] reductase n=2 Tax=Acidiphilium TaxID=522 RepID=A5FYQ2_ACICJ|nr:MULTISPECIES: 3-oxoacyl-[acyl-carrier-protein] reductase [Acidiphilium]ABQ30734.1 3-oxoacyl-[acyl-carrier-protein] reductase [Acidiphilium cryptum JF-5]EGO95637.1 3-oxoacyl-(acyl-carrier-protein) reductase [Acidiphilium sp. PM]KDM67821.1 nodulation protein G [Acidiphilium sp. JA12-A1]BAJ80918.1 3-oxoacyl-[acyl-carrier-protein] reductase [Acidiphilium multivorum AIU301]GAN73318.1 oxidoreductase/SDR, 3-oxoacyl-(acyl carrier protein) reductase [Acidiphilium multivorum AIU301]
MSAELFSLEGRTALVTGASGGIGAAIARTLHGLGAAVALSGTREANLTALAAELGERAHVCPADLSDPKAADALIAAAESALGHIDILVNNAGLTRDGLLLRMSDEAWASVMDVDLAAPFRLSRAVMKGMMRRRSGRIINIGSIVGSTGNPGQVNYAAAKAGLIGMTKAMAQEVASRNITVNLVAPGFVETAMTDALNEAQRASLADKIPLGRLGKPEDIAASVAYLASDAAAWVTGAVLHVNGGMAMI